MCVPVIEGKARYYVAYRSYNVDLPRLQNGYFYINLPNTNCQISSLLQVTL